MERTYEDIIYSKADRVARITINRPDAANMFRAKTLNEMKEALEDSRLDDSVRVVVISGAGDKFFCIGGDKSDLPKTHAYKGVIPVMDVYDLMDKLPKPVIAAVDGFAVGLAGRFVNSLGQSRVSVNRGFDLFGCCFEIDSQPDFSDELSCSGTDHVGTEYFAVLLVENDLHEPFGLGNGKSPSTGSKGEFTNRVFETFFFACLFRESD